VRSLPHPNVPAGTPQRLRHRHLRIGPIPYQRLRPARLAQRPVGVKDPPNPNYFSISLWGVFASQCSAALRVLNNRPEFQLIIRDLIPWFETSKVFCRSWALLAAARGRFAAGRALWQRMAQLEGRPPEPRRATQALITRAGAFRLPFAACILGRISGKGFRAMHRRMLGKQLFNELARQLVLRRAPQNSGPRSAKAPGALSDRANERTRAPEPNVGTLLYLVSFGVVATATVVVFLGLGFFLLVHPNEELIAGRSARDRGIEVEPRRADIVSPPETDAATSTVQTELPDPAAASAPSVPPAQPPEGQEVLPSAGRSTAWASLPASLANSVATNATSDVSASGELQGLRSDADDAALATSTGVTHAKRTGIGRHRHTSARMHWAGVSRAGTNGRRPLALSPPENAWRWIAQSAAVILASLSPPPSRQTLGFRTR
jgi:hypothetical protein